MMSEKAPPVAMLAAPQMRPHGIWRSVRRFARRSPLGTVAGVILLALIAVAVFAPSIAPYPYDAVDLDARLDGPSRRHLLGTDGLGRDVLSRLIYGARISLGVGFFAVSISIVIGTALGILCGYLGGLLDLLVQRVVDVVIAFPALVISISVLAVFGGGIPALAAVLGGVQMTAVIRITRSQSLALRPSAYIEAARASGAATPRILLQHVLPNIVPTSIVLATIYLGAVILAEASLSFLGFGVRPPYPSWGSMLNTSARTQMLRAPALSLWPGIAITLVVFSFNMFGDALRDALDPRLRGTTSDR